jgi:hypothetical protein
MKYEGTVLIHYLGDEACNQVSCRCYRIGGEGLKGHAGLMCANKEKGYIEDIELSLADNPDWKDFKFRLVSSESMDAGQWTEFMDTEIKAFKPKRSYK